ncbi:MAG: hypothetical protein QOJ19_2719 [Acidimicrobiia bacterium]|jgi:rhodanese-related sulfurtransferase|nr:hypothetical protein [Acidimicrobiia bacterium]
MTRPLTRSPVTEIPPADPEAARAHFAALLSLETDCWDVHEAMKDGSPDFALLDVRSADTFRAGHIPGATSLPHRHIDEVRLSDYDSETVFVVYCAGPHCNGADRAAVRLSMLGRPVKKMIGGVEGWIDEGFELVAE